MVTILIDELNNLEAFVTSQVQLGADEKELRIAQGEHMKFRIQSLSCLDMPSATRLTTAIHNVHWNNDIKHTLGSAVRDKVTMVTGRSSAKLPPRCAQSAMTFELFLTPRHWSCIEDKAAPWSVKLQCMVDACKQFDLLLPNEHTRARIIEVLLAAVGMPTVHDKEFFKLYDTFSTAVGKLQKHPPSVMHLQTFPIEPRMLQPAHFKHAYPDPTDQPALKELPSMLATSGGVRKNSKAYKATREPEVLNLCKPSPSSTCIPEQLMDFAATPLGQSMFTMLSGMMSGSSGYNSGGRNVDMPRPRAFHTPYVPPPAIADGGDAITHEPLPGHDDLSSGAPIPAPTLVPSDL